MSVVRYEELDQLAGELLPERTALSIIFAPFSSGYYSAGYSALGQGGGYPDPGQMGYTYHPEYSPYQVSYPATASGLTSNPLTYDVQWVGLPI